MLLPVAAIVRNARRHLDNTADKPLVHYTEFSDFAVRFNAVLKVREYTDQYLVVHEFIKRLFVRYKEEGIEIPLPTREIYLKESARSGDTPR
jgi:small-conductance mechanosensitive channel